MLSTLKTKEKKGPNSLCVCTCNKDDYCYDIVEMTVKATLLDFNPCVVLGSFLPGCRATGVWKSRGHYKG